MPVPPLVSGPDLTDPDAASKFRKLIVADVDELLREHHLRLSQHVDENIEEMQARLANLDTVKRKSSFAQAIKEARHTHVQARSSEDRRSLKLGLPAQSRRSFQEGRRTAASEFQGQGMDVAGLGGSQAGSEPFAKKPSASRAEHVNIIAEAAEVHTSGSGDSLNLAIQPRRPRATVSNMNVAVQQARQNTIPRSFSDEWVEKYQNAKNVQQLESLAPTEESFAEDDDDELGELDRQGVSEISTGSMMGCTLNCRTRRLLSHLRDCVNSTSFEIVTCVLIVSNALFFGVETQFLALGSQPKLFEIVTLCYTTVFALELLLRFAADVKEFYCKDNWLWNLCDTVVVFVSVCELVLKVSDTSGSWNLTYIRIIRISRTVRIFRVVRVLQAFSSLRILLYCVINTLRSLVWTLLLLGIILYIFGILFTQAAAEVLAQDRGLLANEQDAQNWDALKRYYGQLQYSIYTQFKAVTGGVSWQDVSTPLSFVHPFWEVLFMAFISFTYFAVLNVVTGVFCQSAIESATHDKDMVVQAQLSNKKLYTEQLKDLFRCIDSQHSGKVNFNMLAQCLDDQQCQAYFEVLGITSDDAWNLFKLLDDDDSNEIEFEEFVAGCLRLRGSARSIDSHMLLYESRWMMKKMSVLEKGFNDLLDSLAFLGDDCLVDPLEVDEDMELNHFGTSKEHLHQQEKAEQERQGLEAQQRAPPGEATLGMYPEASSGESTTDSPGSRRRDGPKAQQLEAEAGAKHDPSSP